MNDREGKSPLPMELRLGRMFHSLATGRRREQTLPEALSLRQAHHPRDDAVSVVMSLIGLELGNRIGMRMGERGKLLGGLVLIGIGAAAASGIL
jgi:Putative manganese efflux pump